MEITEMKNLTRFCFAATTAFSMVTPAFAQTGDVLIRTTVLGVATRASSNTLGLDVGNATSLAVDGTYFVTPNIGIDVLATFLNVEVKAQGLGSLGSVDLLPPIFLLQYHFMPEAQIRPYVGVGFNYNHFYHYSGILQTVDTHIDNKVGVVAQVGMDYMLNKTLSLNVDLKYLAVKSDVHTSLGNDKLDLKATLLGVGLGYRF
jgi:outer membrane protein